MENTSRKRTHNYRLSYAYDVGSSVDPDIEDVGRWENELQGMSTFSSTSQLALTTSRRATK